MCPGLLCCRICRESCRRMTGRGCVRPQGCVACHSLRGAGPAGCSWLSTSSAAFFTCSMMFLGVQRPARFSDCIRPCRCGVYPGFQQSFRHIDLAESDVYVGDRLAVEVAVDFRIFSAVGEVECTEDGDGCCDGREERGKTDTPALPGMAFGFTFCPPEETFGEQGIREAAGICGRCREGAEHGLRVCQVGRYRVAGEEFPQLLFLCVGCRSVEVEGEQSSYLFIRCHNPLLL